MKATEESSAVRCRRDRRDADGVLPIDKVMAAQADLVEVVHELRQVVCVKG
jgi:tRNA-splicing ligase RtcB